MANATGYYNEQNIDLSEIYENKTNIRSGPTGISISVQSTNTGPLLLQTNTSNVIVRTDLSWGHFI
jgi:hypothetical protein